MIDFFPCLFCNHLSTSFSIRLCYTLSIRLPLPELAFPKGNGIHTNVHMINTLKLYTTPPISIHKRKKYEPTFCSLRFVRVCVCSKAKLYWVGRKARNAHHRLEAIHTHFRLAKHRSATFLTFQMPQSLKAPRLGLQRFMRAAGFAELGWTHLVEEGL